MTLFTDNPFEKMMIQKPDYGKREKSPPEISSPRCAGCPYKGQSPCVGYCIRKIENKTTARTIKRYTCDMEYDIIVPTIGNDRVKQI